MFHWQRLEPYSLSSTADALLPQGVYCLKPPQELIQQGFAKSRDLCDQGSLHFRLIQARNFEPLGKPWQTMFVCKLAMEICSVLERFEMLACGRLIISIDSRH